MHESKSLLLFDILLIYAGFVQTTCILEISNIGGGNQTIIPLMQKWKHGIN